VVAGHPRRADNMTLTNQTERLLGQATSNAPTIMEFQFICTSSSLWFQFSTTEHSREADTTLAVSRTSVVLMYMQPMQPYNLRFATKRAVRTHVHIKYPAVPDCGRHQKRGWRRRILTENQCNNDVRQIYVSKVFIRDTSITQSSIKSDSTELKASMVA
jgi:hypothetical protein